MEINSGEINHTSLAEIEVDAGVKIISLSFGDYHTIALTDKGDIYTWGLESELCGCLGLGNPNTIQSEQIGSFENLRSVRVNKPAKVQIEGTCVAVTAGGWQTGALILKD